MKRLLDILLSSVALIILSPLLIPVAIILRCTGEGYVFYRQERVGRGGRIFGLYKFASMFKDSPNMPGGLLTTQHDPRILPFGRILRTTKINEIPQLLNVLLGDMSLIGPRPLLVEYLPLYNQYQARRHEVRPGITGWAQVNGRNAISWEQKFNYDVWYVDHCSFLLDLKILLKTIEKVFKSEGISQEGQATAEKFLGTKS